MPIGNREKFTHVTVPVSGESVQHYGDHANRS